jgi:hypothetical protein
MKSAKENEDRKVIVVKEQDSPELKNTNIPKPLVLEERSFQQKSTLNPSNSFIGFDSDYPQLNLKSNEEDYKQVNKSGTYSFHEDTKVHENKENSNPNHTGNYFPEVKPDPKNKQIRAKTQNLDNQEVLQVMMQFNEVKTLINHKNLFEIIIFFWKQELHQFSKAI